MFFFFFWVFVGMCLVDGTLAKRVAKALIPIDVYFLGVKTHKNIYNGKKDKNAIKNQDKSSPLARVM